MRYDTTNRVLEFCTTYLAQRPLNEDAFHHCVDTFHFTVRKPSLFACAATKPFVLGKGSGYYAFIPLIVIVAMLPLLIRQPRI